MSKYFQFHKLVPIFVSILLLSVVSCLNQPTEINKSEVLKAIKEIEKSLSEDDFSRWSSNITSTKLNKYFKVLTFYICILDKKNPEKDLVCLTPVSMKASSDVVEVDLAIDYNGTINALYFEKLRGAAKKFLQLGMPSEVTCKFQHVDNKYKLIDMSFPIAYETLFATQGILL